MKSLIVLIAGALILLYNCFVKLRREFRTAQGFKQKAKIVWSYAGIFVGAAVITFSIFI